MDSRLNIFCNRVSTLSRVAAKSSLSTYLLYHHFLTEISSNAATAIIMTPISIAVAQQMGFDPRGICLCCSLCSFSIIYYSSRLSDQSNGLWPGGYKFSDYIRVGFFLAFIFWIWLYLYYPFFGQSKLDCLYNNNRLGQIIGL